MLSLIRLAITRLRVRLKGLIEGYVRDHYANRWRYLVFKRRNYGIGEATELSSTHPSASNNVPSLSNPEPAAISQVWVPCVLNRYLTFGVMLTIS